MTDKDHADAIRCAANALVCAMKAAAKDAGLTVHVRIEPFSCVTQYGVSRNLEWGANVNVSRRAFV